MKVSVIVEGLQFNIPCGDGSQSIKWLALAASNLFARKATSKEAQGNLRAREPVNFIGGSYVPCEVTDQSGKSLGPNMKINEATSPGEIVRVHLNTVATFGDDGFPILTPWAVDAFCSNLALQQCTKQKIDEANAKRREKKNITEAKRLANMERIFGSATSEMATMFEADWMQIAKKLSQPPHAVARGSDLQDLKNSAARHFKEVLHLFKEFSGFAAGETSSISFTEFAHFIHRCRVMDVVAEQATIKRIFKEANFEPVVDNLNPDGAFNRAEFLEALLRCSIVKFGGLRNLTEVTPTEALESLMQEKLLPYVDSNFTEAKEALSQPELQALCYDNFDRLQAAFYKYCALDKSQDQKAHQLGTMNIGEWHQVLEDAGLITVKGDKKKGKKKHKKSIPKRRRPGRPGGLRMAGAFREGLEQNKLARKSFERAQAAYGNVTKDDGEKKREEGYRHSQSDMDELRQLNELTYPEFIEAMLYFSIQLKLAEGRKEKVGSDTDGVVPVHDTLESFTRVVNEIANLMGENPVDADDAEEDGEGPEANGK
eukprot:g85.t1